MIDNVQARESAQLPRSPKPATGRRLWIAVSLVLVLLLGFVIPPLVNLGRYKRRITALIAASLGRPVRLSQVEMRLLPWPGFVLTDLSVAEDPAYGAEPVLHANSVTANIRLLPLWRGKLEIGSISVDEASLNVVHAGPGRWNLDPLFRTAAAKPGSALHASALPYLEATNSRINFKNGAEKLPFSLVNTDLSFWQASPGDWRIRLRGQPARTDVNLDLADTGTVRMEASVHRAPELRLMPLQVDLDWREAQLGQLSRLILGSDPGWRGDLTGELHLTGTPDAARVTTRLRAIGVHRAEFAPASPLDFDANCSFVYRYPRRALENLACDSPLGDGRLRLSGELPGANAPPNLTLELVQIPVAAALDALRTVRSGIDSGLEAAGSISGKLAYAPEQGTEPQAREREAGRTRTLRERPRNPLSGSLTVAGFALSGGSLDQPLQIPRFVLEPADAASHAGAPEPVEALAGTMAVPAGATAPLTVNLRLALSGYEAALHGQVSIARARTLVQTAGWPQRAALDGLAGDPLAVNLTAQGPWVIPESVDTTAPAAPNAPESAPGPIENPLADTLAGTVTLHSANWRADYLANHVEIAQATLHVGGGAMRWDPVDFAYGPVKGTASVTTPMDCASVAAGQAQTPCAPHFQVHFASLDAAALEAAFLGAREKGTLLSDLIARLHPVSAEPWPLMQGTIAADALDLGPVTLRAASAKVKISATSADVSDFTAGLLGGQVSGSGSLSWASDNSQQPEYSLDARFEKLDAAAAGQLLGMRWSGGLLSGSAKVDLSGFTGKELGASANGTLAFDWPHGAALIASASRAGAATKSAPASQLLVRFDNWSGEAQIANGAVTLARSQMVTGVRKRAVEGSIKFGKPPKGQFAVALAEKP